MNIDDFLELGLKGDGSGVLEIYWHKPSRDSPDLVIRGRVPEFPVDQYRGERGFLYGCYLRLVKEVSEPYRDRNVEAPFIEVCLTRERNSGPTNMVQIPLSYIPRRPIILEPKKSK